MMHFPHLQVPKISKRPFHERELIFSYVEISKTLGVTPMSVYRYKRDYPTFPKPITSKAAVQNFARSYGIPRKKGPQPSYRRKQVVYMREQEGKTFRQIAKILRISHQAAHQHWKRHLSGK